MLFGADQLRPGEARKAEKKETPVGSPVERTVVLLRSAPVPPICGDTVEGKKKVHPSGNLWGTIFLRFLPYGILGSLGDILDFGGFD